MSYNYDDSDECYICGIDTEIMCDECGRFACSRIHSKRILVDSKHFIDICIGCQKNLKEGAKIGGIRIKSSMLSSDWHQVRNIDT